MKGVFIPVLFVLMGVVFATLLTGVQASGRLVELPPGLLSDGKNSIEVEIEGAPPAVSSFAVRDGAVPECTVEVVTKVPGRCEKLGRVARACIAGNYMNLFSPECL